jgi:DNA mismatch repair protein MSH2
MLLDSSTANALQVFGKEMERKVLSANNTIFELLNKCKTPFGTRCLKRWMRQPLQQAEEIESRLDRVEYFLSNAPLKTLIQNQLKKLPDLDRLYFIFYKVAAGKKTRCDVSDLIKIYRTVETLEELVQHLQQREISEPALKSFQQALEHNVGIISKISRMIEKGIDMSGTRDSEFFVRPETQASLQAIMDRRKEL